MRSWMDDICLWRSVFKFPGFKLVDTIPLSAYRRASSLATSTFPFFFSNMIFINPVHLRFFEIVRSTYVFTLRIKHLSTNFFAGGIISKAIVLNLRPPE